MKKIIEQEVDRMMSEEDSAPTSIPEIHEKVDTGEKLNTNQVKKLFLDLNNQKFSEDLDSGEVAYWEDYEEDFCLWYAETFRDYDVVADENGDDLEGDAIAKELFWTMEDAWEDIMSEESYLRKEAEDERRDPYGSRGLHRSDFH